MGRFCWAGVVLWVLALVWFRFVPALPLPCSALLACCCLVGVVCRLPLVVCFCCLWLLPWLWVWVFPACCACWLCLVSCGSLSGLLGFFGRFPAVWWFSWCSGVLCWSACLLGFSLGLLSVFLW